MPQVVVRCGEIQPMQRPRKAKAGHFYIPVETRRSKQAVRLAAMAARNALRIFAPTKAPVEVSGILAFRKGDLDNAIKTVLDACEGIIYENDKQVFAINVGRWLSYPVVDYISQIAFTWDEPVIRQKVKAKK